MISVVIPLYNKEKQIAATLRSVFNQTFQDFEVVIVNDGSTDSSVSVVESLGDSRIRLINQKNSGVSAARNRGIDEAKGELIAFLDADDEWKPDYLETILKLIRDYPQCDVFATRYEFVDEFGNRRRSILNGGGFIEGILENYFHVASISDAPLWTSAVVASRESIFAAGGFPIGINSGEDLLTWARLAARYKIAYCKEPKVVYYTPTTGPTGKVPPDLESTNDAVGTALIELSRQYPEKGIDEYVSFWYKMRSVINLGRRNRRAAFQCAVKSVRFKFTNFKSWALMALAVMPSALIRKIIGK